MLRVVFLLISTVLLVCGCWGAIYGASEAVEASHSSTWPSVTGHILSSSVRVDDTHSRRGSGRSYTPLITYSYAVNGNALTGHEIAPGRIWDSSSAHTAVVKFAGDSTTPVYYNPADPTTAVLEPGLSAASFGSLAIAALFIAFSSIGWLAAWSVQPKNSTGASQPRLRQTPWQLTPIIIAGVIAIVVVIAWLAHQ
jgi:hypothetical protein